jgi:CheY-like chemotaxis protein
MLMHIKGPPVIHSRPTQIPVINDVTQGVDEMQSRPGDGAHAPDVSGIGRNFGLEQHNVQHEDILLSAPYESSACSRIAFRGKADQRHVIPAPPVNSAPPKSIVLVDDEKSYTDLMTQMLSDHFECPVHAYTRPLDALKGLVAVNPGVVVTDYYMPQLNGIEFIRQAVAIVPEASFVMITGHNLSAQEDELERLQALKGFLEKPFGWRKLAQEIVRVWPPASPAPAVRADATSV